MKRIRQEILYTVAPLVSTSLLGPSVGVQHLCTRPPCTIKGGRPLENGSTPGGAEDRLIHTKSNTSHSGCRVLCSGGPNHSKSVCSCALAPKQDRANRFALPRVLSLEGIGGCVPPPGCGYPQKLTTNVMISGVWSRIPFFCLICKILSAD